MSLSPIPAPPDDPTNSVADNEAAAYFGRFLFFDARLSGDGKTPCAACHWPYRAFADGRAIAFGIAEGRRNTPTTWNIAFQRWFGLGGRFDSNWSQALVPMEAEAEMGSTRLQIAHVVFEDSDLRRAYEGVFGLMPDLADGSRFPRRGRPVPGDRTHPDHVAWESMNGTDRQVISRVFSNLGKAIAAYERRLISPGAVFDIFVAGLREGDLGKQASISNSVKRGLKLFVGRGKCVTCHFGPIFSDGEFHNLSLPTTGGGRPRDAGRFGGIKRLKAGEFNAESIYSDDPEGEKADLLRALSDPPETWGQFKTPGLRNVAKTAPYMHQGQFKDLEEVIHFYSTLEGADRTAHHKETVLAPLMLSDRQINDLVAFLKSLSDLEVPRRLLIPPITPWVADGTPLGNP